MKKINSYVFLERNENKYLKGKDGNYVLDLNNNVLGILKELFNAKEDILSYGESEKLSQEADNQFEKMISGIKTGTFKVSLEKIIKKINFKISVADSTEYLDIIIEDNNEETIIKFMKTIDITITSNHKICRNYIVITSYDSISEYYCNRVYPKLNEFERKFRKLLYLTYTSQFNKSYFEITTSKELRINTKKIIKSKKEDYRIQNYLYSLDFYAFKQLLFEKTWNEYDENQLKKYLEKHSDLTKLTDLEIRTKMLNIHPINDWERLFSNKGLDDNFEKIITDIGDLRNLVAHNKIITEKDYNKLQELLESSIITIDKAIDVTETEDFKKINNEKVTETLEMFVEAFEKYIVEIKDGLNKLFDSIDLRNTFTYFGNMAKETIIDDEDKKKNK